LQCSQQDFGRALRSHDLRGPFRDRPEHAAIVDFLKRVAPQVASRDLPDEENQRHAILLCCVHGDRRIARTGSATHARDARSASQARICQRHETGARLVTTSDGVYVGSAPERIQQADIAFAGDAENAIDAVGDETVDDHLAGAAHRRQDTDAAPPARYAGGESGYAACL
jgi:hypothetical protein